MKSRIPKPTWQQTSQQNPHQRGPQVREEQSDCAVPEDPSSYGVFGALPQSYSMEQLHIQRNRATMLRKSSQAMGRTATSQGTNRTISEPCQSIQSF